MGTKDRDYILKQLFSKLSIKEEELIRPIVPVEKWVTDEYYVGKDGLKLYPFWRGVIKDIFESGSQYNQVCLSGGIGCTPCYTRKCTSLGYLSLAEIKDRLLKGNSVSVRTENGVEPIKDVHFIGKQKTKILHFKDGSSYECTHNHLFRVLTEDGEIQWVRADQLTILDSILRSANSGVFPKKNLHKDGKIAYVIGLCYGKLGYKTEKSFKPFYYKAEASNFFSIDSLPDCVNLFTRKEVRMFLAGVFDSDEYEFNKPDSDRCVEYNNHKTHFQISYSSYNKDVVYQIQNLLFNLGIYSVSGKVDSDHSREVYRLSIQGFQSIKKFYKEIPLQRDYHKDLISNYIYYNEKRIQLSESYFQDGYTTNLYSSSTCSYLSRNQCYFAEIESIEDSEAECGDIEVEGSHTYISDGIINHNTGKSTCAVFILVRKLYEISCYKSIQGKFHLMDSALIVFLYFSLSKFQAKRTGFKQFKDTIDSIPYFTEHFPRNPKANDELRFPSNVYYLYGTGTGDAIGANVLASILDEANFFSDSGGDGTDYNEVANLHRALIARQESRFLRNGKNESLSVVVSSNTFKSSYTEELKKRSLTDPTIKCYRARSWDIKPKGTYSDIVFYVFCGTDKVDPFIIDTPLDLISKLNLSLDPNQSVKEAVAKLPNELRVLVDEVPIDFKNQYVVNIVKALQDFSGFSVESTNTFFNNRNVFNACIDDSIQSLFTKTEFVIETMNDSPQNSVMFYLSGKPFPHPEKPRFLHVDLGLSTDACGISCCYKSGTKMVDGVEHPTYSFDFSLRIVPPPAPKKISIARTEEFLIYLRDKLHLTIGMISWDAFQSSSSQQRLQELGFPVRYQSVDRTDKAYLYFSECLYLNCVTFNAQFADDIQHELFTIVHYRDKHKIDHVSDTAHGGTKDRLDAVVGALWNAYECVPQEVNFNDTYALSYLNSDSNNAQFTEDSSWLFESCDVGSHAKLVLDQEMQSILKERY